MYRRDVDDWSSPMAQLLLEQIDRNQWQSMTRSFSNRAELTVPITSIYLTQVWAYSASGDCIDLPLLPAATRLPLCIYSPKCASFIPVDAVFYFNAENVKGIKRHYDGENKYVTETSSADKCKDKPDKPHEGNSLFVRDFCSVWYAFSVLIILLIL